MTKKTRIRRVVILCVNFVRNLAYHRAGNKFPTGWKTGPLERDASFWRTVSANCIDQCVLDFCKLFTEKKGQHHWGRVVSDKNGFERELLRELRTTPAAFEKYIKSMKAYRDKFVAHLDVMVVMTIPKHARAKRCVDFLFDYLVRNEIPSGDLSGLIISPTLADFRKGYSACRAEAEAVYKTRQARKKNRR